MFYLFITTCAYKYTRAEEILCDVIFSILPEIITEVLVERGFIRKVATKKMRRDGSWRQSNDHYYILLLPAFPTTGYRTSRRSAAGDLVKNGGTRFSGCRFEFANKLITLPGWDGY